MPKLLDLFLTFLRIGAFTFGGGYVMIPLIQKSVSDDKGWITHDEILEIVAIAESTPGPLAINTATFVGYRIGGVIGAFLATIAVVLPSFVIIILISTVLQAFSSNEYVRYAFMGVRAGVIALIVRAVVSMTKKAKNKNVMFFVIMGLAFAAVVFFRVNVLLVIACSGVIGLVSFLIARRMEK
ncbi:MAG: chromate transporter, partial [Spirochaetales bacterium]|nr:chromate transporter [Spirochaetales bacterium]